MPIEPKLIEKREVFQAHCGREIKYGTGNLRLEDHAAKEKREGLRKCHLGLPELDFKTCPHCKWYVVRRAGKDRVALAIQKDVSDLPALATEYKSLLEGGKEIPLISTPDPESESFERRN